ncbi:hypothetical protein DSO57_1037448 [Entomophthora muscae]|uniref:Uncharacterized protein n=1 Tax=Entomophthora muscae TaxID=34485 RepID=A0ACC2SZ98_9FUNG|nr:hypothetical protein DSO57_1037448 [Entomophthora muscae]
MHPLATKECCEYGPMSFRLVALKTNSIATPKERPLRKIIVWSDSPPAPAGKDLPPECFVHSHFVLCLHSPPPRLEISPGPQGKRNLPSLSSNQDLYNQPKVRFPVCVCAAPQNNRRPADLPQPDPQVLELTAQVAGAASGACHPIKRLMATSASPVGVIDEDGCFPGLPGNPHIQRARELIALANKVDHLKQDHSSLDRDVQEMSELID